MDEHFDQVSRFLSILSKLFDVNEKFTNDFLRFDLVRSLASVFRYSGHVDFVGMWRNSVRDRIFFSLVRYHHDEEDDRREIPLNQPSYLVSIFTHFGYGFSHVSTLISIGAVTVSFFADSFLFCLSFFFFPLSL